MNDDDIKRPGAGGDADDGDEWSPEYEPGSRASVFMAELVGALRASHGAPEGLALREYRESIADEARAAVDRYIALNLAALDEVLRARWQAAFEAKVRELARSGADLPLAERGARESANLEAGKALRRLASDVVREQLSAFLLVGASEAVRAQGEVWSVARPGFPLAVNPVGQPELWGWLARCASGESGLDRDGRPCDDESARWLAAVRVRADWPGEEPARRPAWPWGDYSTPDLELMAEAVCEFWNGWDGEITSAPTIAEVASWFQERGVKSNSRAKVMASLLLSPKVGPGRRPRGEE